MKYHKLIAKTDKNDVNVGLPLWMHLKDTMGIALKLAEEWVPESVFKATGMDSETFKKTAVFLTGIHDIGKATSYFQSVITRECGEQRDILAREGFEINDEYCNKGATPHAWAGQWILQSKELKFGIPDTIAVVVGAHHGKPYEYLGLNGCEDLLKKYSVNFYGLKTVTEKRGKGKDNWIQCWKGIIQDAMAEAGFGKVTEIPELTYEAQILLSGLLIVADWIASNTNFFPLIPYDDFESVGLDVYSDRVEKGWQKAQFPERWSSCTYRMDRDLFRERFGFEPNSIQLQVIDIIDRCKEPGIFILEAPMGSGKTEAAFAAAEVIANRRECSGIFFGLPTQATSNGLFGRLYDWASQVSVETENAVRLAHGASEYNEEYTGHFFGGVSRIAEDEESDAKEKLTVHPWFQGNKRALLADFVIGTVDQFLMASLKRKHFMLRHIGLAGKVVVIDECHAYDMYMNQYLEESIQWMAAYGISVILLSATLPCDRRKKLIDKYAKAYSKYHLRMKKRDKSCDKQGWDVEEAYPLLTWTDGEKIRQEILSFPIHKTKVEIAWLNSLEEMISVLENHISDGGCACIIVNTVKMAQKIYIELAEQMDGYEVILYHAQFTITDRSRKEKDLMERMGKNSKPKDRNRVILIGTQVLEQSLDYDADIMITQLCPMDLLLQRMGRLHRHKERVDRPERVSKAKCFVLGEEDAAYDEGTKKIYGEYLLEKTKSILSQEIILPDDISPLVQEVYREPKGSYDGQFNIPGSDEYVRTQQNKKMRAEQFLLSCNTAGRRTIENILRNEDTAVEKYAESSVRDSASAIEILLMKRGEDGKITFVNEPQGEHGIDSLTVPNFEVGKKIARERLRLPHVFSYSERSVIDELEERNIKELSEWQKCPWLQGELILLLDQEGKTELNGYILSYDIEKGLVCIRKDSRRYEGETV